MMGAVRKLFRGRVSTTVPSILESVGGTEEERRPAAARKKAGARHRKPHEKTG